MDRETKRIIVLVVAGHVGVVMFLFVATLLLRILLTLM